VAAIEAIAKSTTASGKILRRIECVPGQISRLSVQWTERQLDPAEAVEFIAQTGADTLACAIGTSHGAYKFAGSCNVDVPRVKALTEVLPNTPLVMHGSSSVPQKYVEIINSHSQFLIGLNIPLYIICFLKNIC